LGTNDRVGDADWRIGQAKKACFNHMVAELCLFDFWESLVENLYFHDSWRWFA
jgi:hypothetical protein